MSDDDDTRSWITRTATRPAASPASASASAPPVLVESEDDPLYRAWGQGHPETDFIDFRLRPDEKGGVSCKLLPLRFVTSVSYDGTASGDHMTFVFPSAIVTISGQRLDGLRLAIIGGKVGFIAEHDPLRWGAPLPGVPLVQKIDFLSPK